MMTIEVKVEDLEVGDIIVEEIFTDYTNISLFVEGTVIDEKIKTKLMRSNVEKIMIARQKSKHENIINIVEDEHRIKKAEFKDQYREKVNDFKSLFQNVLNGEEIEPEKVEKISEDIFGNIDNMYVAIESISELKDFDDYTYTHSINVALYSMLLAKWIGLEKDEIEDLVQAAILLDIGKAKVDPGILNKPGTLTDEEFLEIRNHAQYGYDMFKDMDDINEKTKDVILSHHERIDGSGYPNGIKGDEISLFAKIVAICDVYDAVTSDRVYKDKITPFKAYNEIMEHGYGKLDTELMLTFLNNIGDLYVGLNVKMNTGEIGEIIFVPFQRLSYPLVKIGEKFVDLATHTDYEITEII